MRLAQFSEGEAGIISVILKSIVENRDDITTDSLRPLVKEWRKEDSKSLPPDSPAVKNFIAAIALTQQFTLPELLEVVQQGQLTDQKGGPVASALIQLIGEERKKLIATFQTRDEDSAKKLAQFSALGDLRINILETAVEKQDPRMLSLNTIQKFTADLFTPASPTTQEPRI